MEIFSKASICRHCGKPLTVWGLVGSWVPIIATIIAISLTAFTAWQARLAFDAYGAVQTLQIEMEAIALDQARVSLLALDGQNLGGTPMRETEVLGALTGAVLKLIPDHQERTSWYKDIELQYYIEYDENEDRIKPIPNRYNLERNR